MRDIQTDGTPTARPRAGEHSKNTAAGDGHGRDHDGDGAKGMRRYMACTGRTWNQRQIDATDFRGDKYHVISITYGKSGHFGLAFLDFRACGGLTPALLGKTFFSTRRPALETGGQRPTARCALGRKSVWKFVLRQDRGTTALFDNLSEKLGGILDRLTGRGSLTEADVDAAMREVRRALLEADVSLDVVRSFIDSVREQAIGATVVKSVTPGQMVVKIVHDELVATLGADGQTIDLNAVPPVAIMMVGLQGSGKTTTTAKLARRMTQRDKRKVLMASLDIYRPAAMEQLAVLGRDLDIPTLPIVAGQKPAQIAARAGSRQARRLRRGAARHRRPHHAHVRLETDGTGQLGVGQRLFGQLGSFQQRPCFVGRLHDLRTGVPLASFAAAKQRELEAVAAASLAQRGLLGSSASDAR